MTTIIMKIEGFEIVEMIADGNTCAIWKARQTALDRIVTLKILKPHLAQKPDVLNKFISDAQAAAKIKHHNVIQVFDVSVYQGHQYIVMEYVAGQTLTDILEENTTIDSKHSLKIALAIAHALMSAWDTNHVIHGGLCPDEVMLDKDGNIKLARLGMANALDPAILSVQINDGTFDNTAYYMSPEQARCQIDLDCRSDMYSLGAILYDMMTGIPPFEGDNPITVLQKHISAQIENPRDIERSVSLGAASLITRLMMKNPDDRFKDWSEVIKEINKVRRGGLSIAKKGSAPKLSTIMLPSAGTPALPGAKPSKNHTEDNSVHLAIQLPAWLLLFLWWMLLAFIMYKTTSNKQLRIANTIRLNNEQILQSAAARHVKPPAKEVIKKVTPRIQPEKTVNKQNEMPDAISYTPDITPAPTESNAEVMRFKLGLLQHVMSRDFFMAHTVLSQELEYEHPTAIEDEYYKLQAELKEMTLFNSIVYKGFSRKTGQTITIEHKGRNIDIKIKQVNDDQIMAEMLSVINGKDVSKNVSFTVAQLDPNELIKWLDNSISDHARHSIEFVLHMEANNLSAAKAIAAQCGPLSDVFQERLLQ